MGELDLAALLAFGAPQKEAIAASDPYLKAKVAPDLVGDVLLKNAANPDWSTKDKIVAGLLAGLGSGVLGGLSTDYQGRAGSAYRDVVAGNVTERPSVLDADIFNAARNQRDIFLKAQELELAKEKRAADAKAAQDAIVTKNDIAKAMLNSDKPSIRAVGEKLAGQILGLDLASLKPKDATAEMRKAEGTDREELAIKLDSDDKAEKLLAKEEEAARKSWFEALRPSEKEQARDARAFATDLYGLAEEFKNLESTPVLFSAKTKVAGFPESEAYAKLLARVMPIIRQGGAAANASQKEEARALESMLGNITSGGGDAAIRIKNIADYYLSKRVGNLQTAKQLKPKGEDPGADALLEELQGILATQATAPIATPTPAPVPTPGGQNITSDGKFIIDHATKTLIPIK